MSAVLNHLRASKQTPLGQHQTENEEYAITERLLTSQRDAIARRQAASPPEPVRPQQVGLMRYLLSQLKTHNAEVYATAQPWCDNVIASGSLTKVRASEIIDRLRAQLAAPAGVTTPPPATTERRAFDPYDDIPSGYYAVSNDKGHTSFYRVRRHNDRLYVDLQVSDSFNRIPWAVRKAALDKIRATGAEECGRRYAAELGRCYRCGRTLTDEVSRELGIGPTCRNK